MDTPQQVVGSSQFSMVSVGQDPCREIHVASWNISAVNNNPFEYWTTSPDPAYDMLMQDIQRFIDSPEKDLEINQIFEDSMFSELLDEMRGHGINGLQELELCWTQDYRTRKAVQGFLKDKSIGTKRLASMPDRITNTINLQNGGVSLRPSVMNAYDGLEACSEPPHAVCRMIAPILRGKYPAITEEEQAISVPLQILCLAILDAILVHILNTVGQSSWQPIRRALCDALIVGKAPRVCSILAQAYHDCDVIFIQEAAAVFVHDARNQPDLRARYALLAPALLDGRRDQNSLILVSRNRFDSDACRDVTPEVLAAIGGSWVAPGDLLVVSIPEREEEGADPAGGGGSGGGGPARWLLASFHGDSNGLSTQPMLIAVAEVAALAFPDHTLLAGLDANTHSGDGDGFHQTVAAFAAFLCGQNLVSLWGPAPDPAAWTACSSRTCVQTQLNKAVPIRDRFARAQRSLKDWLVADAARVCAVSAAARDNTGRRRFVDGAVLPTLEFPSDHAIVSAVFHLRDGPPAAAADSTAAALPAAAAVWQAASRPQLPGARGGRECTLYDYWGIGARPLALEAAHPLRGSLSSTRATEAELEEDCGLPRWEEARRMVEDHYVRLAWGCGWSALDGRKEAVARGNDRSIWILFSTRPFTMAIRKPWFSAMAALAGSALLAQGVVYALAVRGGMPAEGRHFRFTALALRNGSAPGPGPAGIAALGVLRQGCRVAGVPALTVSDGAGTVTIALKHPVSMDGWWFETATEEPPEGDPVRFRLERSVDGVAWERVARPMWISDEKMWDVPVARGAMKAIDLRPPVLWVVSHCVGINCFSLSCYVSCLLGLAGRGRMGAVAMAVGYLLISLTEFSWALQNTVALISGLGDTISISPLHAWTQWMYGIGTLLSSITVYREKYIFEAMFFCFMLIGSVSAYEAVLISVSIGQAISMEVIFTLVWSVSPAVTLLLLLIARIFTSRWVLTHFLAEDRCCYDDVWKKVVVQDQVEGNGTLSTLAQLSEDIKITLNPTDARQYLSTQITKTKICNAPGRNIASANSQLPLIPNFSHSMSVKMPSERVFISSLDQLMEQAKGLNIFLKQKSTEIALISDGAFLVACVNGRKGTTGFERYRSDSSLARNRFLWASVKSSERSIEKLLRSYDCDVSRLLDCCRQTIVFDSPSNLYSALKAIRADREIKIVRIKNMLDEKFDSWRTGGFRNLVLNICIQTAETSMLGIERHVCELQLTLEVFASKMTKASHGRYLVWRNCRDAPWMCNDLVAFFRNISHSIWHRLRRSKNVCHPLDREDDRNSTCALDCISTQSSSWGPEKERALFLCEESESSKRGPTSSVKAVRQHLEKSIENDMSMSCGDASNLNGFQDHDEKALRSQVNEMLREQYRMSATSLTRYEKGHISDAYWKGKMVEIAVQRAANGSIWDNSHPLASLLCKQWFPWLLVAVISSLLVSLAAYLSLTVGQNLVSGRRFRFTTLKLRSEVESNITGPGIRSIGFLENGCGDDFARLQPTELVGDGCITVSFSETISINGWWFETQNQSKDLDPVIFVLERSMHLSGDVWDIIGSSSWSWTWSGTIAWGFDKYSTTELRNSHEYFDLSVPWIWSAHRVACNLVLVLMVIAIIIVRRIKHHLTGKWIVVALCSVNALLNAAASVLYGLHRQWKVAFVAGCFSVVDLGLPTTLIFSERSLLTWVGIAGIAYPFSVLIHYLVLVGFPAGLVSDRGLGLIRNVGLLEGFGYVCLFVFGWITRFQSRWNAQRIVKEDYEAYNACWIDLERKWHGTFEKMLLFTIAAGHGLPAMVRQPDMYSSEVIQDITWSTCHGAHPSDGCQTRVGKDSLVHQLEQLFVRAAGLNIFLQFKIKEWALKSKGCFPLKCSFQSAAPSYMQWECIREQGLEHSVQWARLKTLDRALEKVYRSYRMDAARLLDCCRQSIFFEDAEALFDCLKAVCSDTSVRLARVSNRLHNGYDASATAGFRHVLLNLSISTEETRRLRLDGAVCELQLVLIDFAKFKSDEGHKRYVLWRNQRGQ